MPTPKSATDRTVTVDAVTAAAYQIPTETPESDGTLSWDDTTLVVVDVTGGGHRGTGYTYAHAACVPLVDGVLERAVVGRDAMDVSACGESMIRACRNLGRPGLVSCAVSAVDTALWDLKGKLLGLPVCRLLGVVRRDVPVYGSGGFTNYGAAATRAQLRRWTQEKNIPRVKIKIAEGSGGDERRDLERVALARDAIGPDAELYVDANGGYRRKQAVRVGAALAAQDVTWFEEPVTSDDLDGLRQVRERVSCDVTAGEYGFDRVYFARMVECGAVDCLQVDVTRCGGITEWLVVAALAAAHGLDVSGHCAPTLHAHPAAAVGNVRHLEYFHDHARIETRFLDGAPDPDGGVVSPDLDRPGLGFELKRPDVEPYRTS